jgi:hypothetical protein
MNQNMDCNDLVCCVNDAWAVFMDGLENSIRLLDEKLTEAEKMSTQVTGEWAVAIEHVMDDLENFVFSISEPRNSSEAYSKRLKDLRHRLHEHYVRFKSIKETKGLQVYSPAA